MTTPQPPMSDVEAVARALCHQNYGDMSLLPDACERRWADTSLLQKMIWVDHAQAAIDTLKARGWKAPEGNALAPIRKNPPDLICPLCDAGSRQEIKGGRFQHFDFTTQAWEDCKHERASTHP